MTAAEPISVRIARARGCSPLFIPAERNIRQFDHWRCSCKASHTPSPHKALLWEGFDGEPPYEAWLEPAASFALLQELVEAGEGPQLDASPTEGPSRSFFVDLGLPGKDYEADTLPLAIANAYLARKQTRQSLVHPPGCSSHIPTRECDCMYSGRRGR